MYFIMNRFISHFTCNMAIRIRISNDFFSSWQHWRMSSGVTLKTTLIAGSNSASTLVTLLRPLRRCMMQHLSLLGGFDQATNLR